MADRIVRVLLTREGAQDLGNLLGERDTCRDLGPPCSSISGDPEYFPEAGHLLYISTSLLGIRKRVVCQRGTGDDDAIQSEY